MRRCLPGLLILLSLTGCTSKQIPAPAATAAEGAAPAPALDPAPLRVEPRLSVRTLRATRLFTGPGPWYLLIRELPAEAAVEYLANREGWLKVRTPEGESGWLTMADAELADGRGQAVTYAVKNGRWELKTGAGLSVELARAGTGVMRLTIAGLTAPAAVLPAGENAVFVRTALPAGLLAADDIGDSGVGRISLSEQGILIDLEGAPLALMAENRDGRVVLEIRPGLTSLEQMGEGGWRLAYQGDLRPALRQDGSELVLDLPGALPGPGVSTGSYLQQVGPEDGPAAASPTAPNALPPARMPAGGLRLRVPTPKGPYALYRPGPGRLELRFLPAGLTGKTVVIDPGHGGEETGAVGPAGTIEKEINLAVALRLKPLLEQAGARVLMTRTADVRVLPRERWAEATSAVERTQLDLAARSAISNGAVADLFVSVHANGGPAGDGGTEVYWAVSNLNAVLSQRLAKLGQQELLGALGLADRGAKQRPFNVIRMSDAPAMLVEMGFVTDPDEERLLASPGGQQAAAEAIARAVGRYFAGP
ncbi:MAG TPA: N-acetylmuramoyl-L-alanine amidase [Symbiobacteriaceae bacterium]|nr:N-acetylmuramoyl-L-alanine amidase [Symbiobacteriaceae bacterium]